MRYIVIVGLTVSFQLLSVNSGAAFGDPIPANDLCQDALYPPECQNQVSIANPGYCELSGGSSFIHEPCNLDVGPSPNHDCINTQTVCQPSENESYHCQFETDNRFALTDGPNTQGGTPPTCFASGLDSFQADIWFRYVAPCDGYMAVINCRIATYDSMIQVLGNHTATCPSCPISNNVQSLGCSDDNCSACCAESASQIRINGIKEGACYLIRMGGYSQFGTPESASQNQSGLEIGVVCDLPLPIEMPTSAPPPHDRLKNRYIAFAPNNAQNAVAFRVEKTSGLLGDCWVSAPDAGGNSKCVGTPTFRTWGEPVIHVGDCEIMPVQGYHIRGFTPDMAGMPDFLYVRTIYQPTINSKFWGDVAGFNNGSEWTPPNLVTNVNDILAVLAYISNAPIKPTFQVVNLQAISSADPCLNAFVNTADVLIVVKAAAGDAYPFTTDPANCPSCP